MNIDPTQFYNSAIAAISTLIAGQLLLFCACVVLLRRVATPSLKADVRRSFVQSSVFFKIKAICMHGILSSKGHFSVELFRQVFLLTLAPAR